MPQPAEQQQLREVLRTHGLRYSRPREAILSFFRERDVHLSAESLYLALKARGENLSLSTVYLNLGVLTQVGLVREFGGLNGEALYDSNIHPHYHLLCRACGEILDLPAVEGVSPARFLKERAEASTGWKVDEPDLILQGTCPDCGA